MKLLISSFSIIIIAILFSAYTPPLNDFLTSILGRDIVFGQDFSPIAITNKLFSKISSVIVNSKASSIRHVSNMTVPRTVSKHYLAREQPEGAGATVRRSVGVAELRQFSPFLMLDHFTISPGAGFPDHPHYGQETITYLLEGAVDHEDFTGSAGTIEAGDLQFMTAGKGIMHAEMPNPNFAKSVGMQLWVDLPQHLRTSEPRYRDLKASEIPKVETDGGKVNIKVISGRSHGVDSVRDLAYTPVWILDIEVKPGGSLSQELPQGWNAFAYVLEGSPVFGIGKNETSVPQFHNAVFDNAGDVVAIRNPAESQASTKIILIAGQPQDQQTVQRGPFVAGSREELGGVFESFYNGKDGFKRAKGWESNIGKAMA